MISPADFSILPLFNGGVVKEYTNYESGNRAELLVGPQYVLLRPEFAAAHGKPREPAKKIIRILIVDCGHRFTHHIPGFLYALEKVLKAPKITLISRDFAENPNRLNSALDIKCVPAVGAMAAAMLDCDVAFAGGG